MRSLLYIVICTIGLACFTPAYANKAQLPNKIALTLKQPVVTGSSLKLTTELSAVTDFYKGSARLVISSQGNEVTAPIEVFSGDGQRGFGYNREIALPILAPGQYKIHGTFSIYLNQQDRQPIRAGSNLYLVVSANQVLSSNISFNQIKRLKLKAQLEQQQIEQQQKGLQTNDSALLKRQNPGLYQSLNRVNQLQTVQADAEQTIKAQSGSVTAQRRVDATTVQVIELSTGRSDVADPRKRLKQKAVQLDRKNAVLETQNDQF